MDERPTRVLLVEDNPGDARLIREMLSEAGTSRFEPEHVTRLDEALKRLDEDVFDAVLLDLGLPDSQGPDTFTKVNSQMPNVPIVVLTGLSDEALAVSTVREGAQDYLVKGQVDSNLLMRATRYAIERKEAELEIARHAERLEVIAELTRIIGSSLNISDVYETFAQGVKRLVDFDRASIALVEEGNLKFLAVSSSVETELIAGATVPLVGTATAWVMANKCTNIEEDFAEEQQFTMDEVHHREGLRSAIRVPLISKGEVFGTFDLVSCCPNAYDQSGQAILEELTGQIAVAIENDKLFNEVKRRQQELEIAYKQLAEKANALANSRQELEEAYLNMARTIVLTQEARESYTRGHADRVTLLCQKTASEMGLPSEGMGQLEAAARLHDLGRVSVPKEILFKPSSLTDGEMSKVQLHLAKASELLRPFDSLNGALSIIECHHEHYDGKGYPNKLKGGDIPMGARILAVADAYDAMTSSRPYRAQISSEEAIETIREGAGKQWDPEVVEAFLCAIGDKT